MYKVIYAHRTDFKAETRALLDSTPLPKDIIEHCIRPFFKEEAPLLMPQDMLSLKDISDKLYKLTQNVGRDMEWDVLKTNFLELIENKECVFMRSDYRDSLRVTWGGIHIHNVFKEAGYGYFDCFGPTNLLVAIFKNDSTINPETVEDQLKQIAAEQDFVMKNGKPKCKKEFQFRYKSIK